MRGTHLKDVSDLFTVGLILDDVVFLVPAGAYVFHFFVVDECCVASVPQQDEGGVNFSHTVATLPVLAECLRTVTQSCRPALWSFKVRQGGIWSTELFTLSQEVVSEEVDNMQSPVDVDLARVAEDGMSIGGRVGHLLGFRESENHRGGCGQSRVQGDVGKGELDS